MTTFVWVATCSRCGHKERVPEGTLAKLLNEEIGTLKCSKCNETYVADSLDMETQ
jgi:transposase